MQKIREAERDKQYEVFKDRIGDIINGAVKRVEYGNVVVDLGGAGGEAVVRRDELIPREMFRPGDRIRAYVYDVRREARGPQIFLSRTHPQFTAKLFTQEVPEIYDGIVEVRAVARDPGSRAKIAVTSNDSSIDPVGACVGMRGSRVQAVVNELQGEKIDIIPWSPDAATFIVNALQPAEVMKVVLDEDSTRIEVVVPDDQLSLAIGRRGQNVRLASQLTGWDIDILTEAEESERRQKEFAERTSPVHGRARRRRDGRAAAGFGRLPHGRGNRLCRACASSLRSKASTTIRRPRSRRARRIISPRSRPNSTISARRWASPTTSRRSRASPRAMLVKLGENGVKIARGPRRLRQRRSRRLDRRRIPAKPGFLAGFDVTRAQADAMILDARVRAGWIEAPAPAPEGEADNEEGEAA